MWRRARSRVPWLPLIFPVIERATTRGDGSFYLNGLTTAPYNLVIASKAGFGLKPPADGVTKAVIAREMQQELSLLDARSGFYQNNVVVWLLSTDAARARLSFRDPLAE